MKKVLSLIVAIIYTVCTYAQAGGGAVLEKEYQLFDFSLNASRLEAGITAGQVGSFTCFPHFSSPLTKTALTAS